jgi:hypothetical protein
VRPAALGQVGKLGVGQVPPVSGRQAGQVHPGCRVAGRKPVPCDRGGRLLPRQATSLRAAWKTPTALGLHTCTDATRLPTVADVRHAPALPQRRGTVRISGRIPAPCWGNPGLTTWSAQRRTSGRTSGGPSRRYR